jgi:hypothetical protein
MVVVSGAESIRPCAQREVRDAVNVVVTLTIRSYDAHKNSIDQVIEEIALDSSELLSLFVIWVSPFSLRW